jgi:hypothetical protein
MAKWVILGPRHLGHVDELHDQQQAMVERDGLKIEVDRPCLIEKPVLISMGLEDDDGNLLGGFYTEAVAELQFFGTSREVTEAAIEKSDEICETLRGLGIRWLRCYVPKKKGFLRTVGDLFAKAGLKRESKLVMFSRDLRRKAG